MHDVDFHIFTSFILSIINSNPAEPGYVLPFANHEDTDQLASEEANLSGSALFVINFSNLY